MTFRVVSALVCAMVAGAMLVGCAAGPAPGDGPGREPEAPPVSPADEADAERAAMECVTGAWVADASALQEMFDAAGTSEMPVEVSGSIVYAFIEHGFGLTVIPTAFEMRMDTGFRDVVGTITGQASGLWTVKGDFIHAAGESWQSSLGMRWTFMGADFQADTGTQELVDGFTDVDRFECSGDELVLQSAGSPPLFLSRMVER